jgi:hypothetical protein
MSQHPDMSMKEKMNTNNQITQLIKSCKADSRQCYRLAGREDENGEWSAAEELRRMAREYRKLQKEFQYVATN